MLFEGDNKLHIIIAKNLSVVEKAALINVLQSHNEPLSPLPNHANYFSEIRKELKICETKTDETSVDESPKIELKDLPPHLEYAFLEELKLKLSIQIAPDLDKPFERYVRCKRFPAWGASGANQITGIRIIPPSKYLFAKKIANEIAPMGFLLLQEFTLIKKRSPPIDDPSVCKLLKSLSPDSVPPRAIKSDRGSPFFAMTNCVQKVMLNTESPHRLSTAYHPQKDGQVEESLQPAGLDHHCKHPSLSLPSTVELSQANGPNFKVNGHRVKHYFGGDLPQLELLRIVKALVFLSDLSIRSL
ncbi:reverse transcriptase domain-containing protein [Tanacetum coccineum]